LIAAVDGYALAGGMELAISCDLIVANREAKFGIPEVKRGLVAGAGGLIKLPRQIPPRIAMELALTGEFIDAERAHEIGLVNHLTFGPAIEGARELAAKIGVNGPLAVRVSKRIVVESEEWSKEEMWKKQGQIVGPVFISEDAREGAAAFAEKRAPNWKGK
jgi:enoyl-CoA hydratase